MEEKFTEILVFCIENQKFAINLQKVDCVIRAQAITKIADMPYFIEGVLDFHGEVIPVVNLRKKFSYQNVDLKIDDRFIIINSSLKKLALIVDEVEEVLSPNINDIISSKEIIGGLKIFKLLNYNTSIILIYELEDFLSNSEVVEIVKIIDKTYRK